MANDQEYRGTVFYFYVQSRDTWCVSRAHHDGKVQEVHDFYRALLEAAAKNPAFNPDPDVVT